MFRCRRTWRMAISRPIAAALAVSMVLGLAQVAGAQTSRPAAVAPAGRFENQPLRKPAVEIGPAGSATGTAPSSAFDLTQVMLALGAVIGLILALRWGGKRFFGAAAAARPTGVVRVLARSMLAPKQQLMLVQVGKRVLVVGDSGGRLDRLSEITDAEEVAELVGQLRREREDSTVKTFSSLFRREERGFDGAGESAGAPEAAAVGDEGVAAEEPGKASLDQTQRELGGLAAKVRMLARQFGK